MKLQVRGPKARARVLLGAFVAAGAFTTAAIADSLDNTLDATVSDTYELMSLKLGEAWGSTDIYVAAASNDGEAGCNLNGNNPDDNATFAVESDNPAVAEVSLIVPAGASSGPNRTALDPTNPKRFTVRKCGGTIDPVLKVNVTQKASGTANVNFTQVSNNSGGSFNLATAGFEVEVVEANTPPSVAVTFDGLQNAGAYSKQSFPTVRCVVSDVEDGILSSTTAAAPSFSTITGPDATNGIGTQTATCSYQDGANATTSREATYFITDGTAPAISKVVALPTPDGNDGWYRTRPVTLDWTVSEGDSTSTLQTTGCADQTLTGDQAATTYDCSATSSGGSASDSVSIKIDGTAPAVSGQILETPIHDGWFAGDVAVDWSCTEELSGLAAGCPADGTIAGEGTGLTTSSGVVYDNAGNSGSATSPAVKIDRTAPSVSGVLSGDKTTVGSIDWYKDTATVTWSASDTGGSGVANGPTPSSHTVGEGSDQTRSATAIDNVGRQGTGEVTGIYVDATDPTVSAAISSTPAYGSWHRDSVDISVTASDGQSGLAGDSVTSGTVTRTASGTYTATAKDNVGHTATSDELSFQVDAVDPAFGACPAGPFILGQTASITASDGQSGLDVTGTDLSEALNSVGPKTLTFTAKDNVGHVVSQRCSVSVQYAWTGYLQPINDTAHQIGTAESRFKLGSTVPVKFRLADSSGAFVAAGTAPAFERKYMGPSCDTTGDIETGALAPTSTGATFKWDFLLQQYHYNFSTKGLTAGEWRILARLDDGSVAKSVDICLTK